MNRTGDFQRRLLWGAAGITLALAVAVAVALHGAHAAGAAGTPLLPNLVADPPDNTTIATDTSTGTARLLLRFNGYVHNVGPGAVDFRGSREKPKVSKTVEEEVQRAKEKQESLPQKTEEELAAPPMKVFQRLFTTNVGEEETNIERAHVDETSSGEIIYVSADGHHHWHLQRVAKYSLWNGAKSAEVAPAMKVGFCLEDSQHVETSVGPSSPVYADNVAPFRDFCQQYNPIATALFEGISPGWRDVYNRELSFQWVDISNVLPGEYWLREDVNPLGTIKETGGANAPSYATSATIVPGFDALAQSASVQAGEPSTLTLTSRAWNDSSTPKYTIVTPPHHGTLGAVSGSHVTYTPEAGFTGTDSFTFSAADPSSQFPTSPAVATVSMEVVPAGTRSLLAGDATSTYTVGDQTTSGREEAFQFTAKSSGTVEEMQFRTNATANSGMTGVKLGIFSDNAGKPGEVLGQATASGEPAASSWVKVTGLSTAVVAGTKYWLVALPLGPSTSKLHYNAAVGSGGSGNVESTAGGLSTLTAESSWQTFNQGPVGFQAIGTTGPPPPPPPSVTIEGAPASMTAGTSVQLKAAVSNDSPTVTWTASAGSITSGGLFTAPSEPPAGGNVVVTATTSKGAEAHATITIVPAGGTKGLLAGDATSTYTVGDQTTAGREEAFQFTAKSSGTVEEMQFRTNATANTGVTGVALGILSENAGKPGEVLGQASVSGLPAPSSWVKVTGLTTQLTNGTKYWLVVLPLGPSTSKLHYNVAVGSGGTGNVESTAGGLTALAPESSWQAFNQGPVGFQALGTTTGPSRVLAGVARASRHAAAASRAGAARSARARAAARRPRSRQAVMIEGAPSRISAGATIRFAAQLAHRTGAVAWRASAGSIASDGTYTAPSSPPRGHRVLVTATAAGARDIRAIEILPAARQQPAPTLHLSQAPSPGTLATPQAMLVDRTLVIATAPGSAGTLTVSAQAGQHRLGTCSALTPEGRSFTCRLALPASALHARIDVSATLRAAGRVIAGARRVAAVSPMRMLTAWLRSATGASATLQLICGP
jgi:hypothetical protein